MSSRQSTALIAGLLLLTVARLLFASAFPLVDDEAYYWTWSRHLAWGYPDHPPMIAGLIRLTTALAGHTALGVRLGPVLLALGTSLLLFDLGRKMFGVTAGALAAIGFQLFPAITVGSIFAVPDAPYVFFWMLTLWFLWRARASSRAVDWYAAGAALGLAALGKLTAVFLAISAAGFILTVPSERRWILRVEPYGAAVLALAVFLPVIAWNADHRWITFTRARAPIPWINLHPPILDAPALAAAQLVYYGPLVLLTLLALWESLKPARRADPRFAFLAWGALPILAFTWLTSFNGLSKPHWPAPGYIVALIPTAALWLTVSSRVWWRRVMAGMVATNLVIVAGIMLLPFWPGSSIAGEVWGWDQVAKRLRVAADETPAGSGFFILATRYQTASQIAYHLRERYLVTTPDPRDTYAVGISLQHLIDWNAIFINDVPEGPGLPLHLMFRRVEQLPSIEVVNGGRAVRRFSVFRGFGFRGLPRPTVQPM